MRVWLIRHGIAEAEPPPGHEDEQRVLTDHGRRALRGIGRLLAAQDGPPPERIVASPLVRAVQTAEILAAAIEFDGPIEIEPALGRGSVNDILDRVKRAGAAPVGPASAGTHLALVGHEPTMSQVAARLLGLPAFPQPFKAGTVCCIEDGRFRFLIAPDGPTLLDRLDAT